MAATHRRSPEARQAETAQLIAQIETGVEALTSSDDWKNALAFAATFHRYSFNNLLLIWIQCPDATAVAGYRAWQAKGRQVRKGEHAIAILAPLARTMDDETTGETVRRIVGFRAARVFDIAQTDGPPIPEPVTAVRLTGDAPDGAVDRITAAIQTAGYTVSMVPREKLGAANGMTDHTTHTVVYADDLEPAQQVKTLAHEYGHAALHGNALDMNRARKEVEAESVSYVVATALGLDPAGYTMPYVASWSGGDTEIVRASAQRITTTAHTLIDTVIESADAAAELALAG